MWNEIHKFQNASTRRTNKRLTMVGGVLLIGLIAPALTAFFFPLELETREATVWLHVLTMMAGIDVYDHSKVAFINMNHGPMDPILKYIIYTMFPALEAWQVTRIFVILLPLSMILLSWVILRQVSTRPYLESILWGTSFYFILPSISEMILAGRSGDTYLFFCTILFIVIFGFFRNHQRIKSFGIVIGILSSIMFLVNWRSFPLIIGIYIILFGYVKYILRLYLRQTILFFSSSFLGVLSIFLSILGLLFKFDYTKYYKHFFGFFTSQSGWGASPSPDFYTFTRGLVNLGLVRGLILLACVVALVFVVRRLKNKGLTPNQKMFFIWIISMNLLAVSLTTAFYLNQGGGNLGYLDPVYLLLGVSLCFLYSQELRKREAKSGSVLLILGSIVASTIFLSSCIPILKDTIFMMRNMPVAYQLTSTLREIDQKQRAGTEDIYFFRSVYRQETIDMGDTVSAVVKSGYYEREFNETANKYFENIRKSPPGWFVAGITMSPETKKILDSDYIRVFQTSRTLRYNNAGISIWIHKDSRLQESVSSRFSRIHFRE